MKPFRAAPARKLPGNATRLMGGEKIKTRPSEKDLCNLCELLRPGMGLGMGMEPRGEPPPIVEVNLIAEDEELLISEAGEQLIAQ